MLPARTTEQYQSAYSIIAIVPKYTDSPLAQSIIYEIQGNYAESINCYKETLKNLKSEWSTTEGAEVTHIKVEIKGSPNIRFNNSV